MMGRIDPDREPQSGFFVLFSLLSGSQPQDHMLLIGNPESHRVADELISNLAHLYRRAGFGAPLDRLKQLAPAGYNAAVDALLVRSPGDPGADAIPRPNTVITLAASEIETIEERKARNQTRAAQRREITMWWMDRMVATSVPLREKLTFFWHGHFATSIEKVNEAAFMLSQNEIFRSLGSGRFEALTQAVAKDPAMMIWLDSNQNKKGSPNENFARELMELFTIGIGSYTDADVREAARAFTGWRINRKTGEFSVLKGQHDAGQKTILGRVGAYGGEEVISLLANHPAATRFVASKLWSRFAFPVNPDDPIVTEVAAGFASDGDITTLMRSIFRHPEFVSKRAKQGLVKQPVEWMVGALRALNLPFSNGPTRPQILLNALRDLNQVPFAPPSVGGWPQNGYWVSTATAHARLATAATLSRSANLSWLTGVPASQRLDVLASQLGLDGWTSATTAALVKANDPKSQLAIALVSPEYVLN